MPNHSNADRFYDIDGLRFIAALVVVFYHYTFRGYAADGYSPVPFEGLGVISRYGYLGVDLFFIISGFVILMSAGHGNSVKFVISRFVRIYPTLWIAIILTGSVMFWYDQAPLSLEVHNWLLNFALIGSYVGVPYVDGVYWSLLVELKFYFLVFVVLLFGRIHQMVPLLLGWLVVTFILTFSPVRIPYAGFFFFPEWSHYFIAGATFYLARRDGFDLAKWILLTGSLILSVYIGITTLDHPTQKYQTEFSPMVVGGLIISFYVFFLLISLKKTKLFNVPWMLKFGALTYPLYLIHQNIGYVVLHKLGDQVNPYALLITLLVVMIVLSYVINEFAEQKLNRFVKAKVEQLFEMLNIRHQPRQVKD